MAESGKKAKPLAVLGPKVPKPPAVGIGGGEGASVLAHNLDKPTTEPATELIAIGPKTKTPAPPAPPAVVEEAGAAFESAQKKELPPERTADTDILNKKQPTPSAVDTRVGSIAAIHAVPTVGDKIGKYTVDRLIGSGGMGLVVAARHEQLNELVAIKLLRPKAAGDKIHAERFAREARAIIKIKSEHVVRVFDAGTLESGAPYIVMEYLVGRDLSQIVRAEGALHPARAADLMLQVCEAVASAHAANVIHRDLKPSNFFVTQRADGETLVKVLDFGISKAVGQEGMPDPNLTETQAVFGSPTYMSPEQIRSAKHVDHRSDVWSLGVCLYELVTGKLPFAADNVAGLLASIVADPPFYPRGFAPQLPQQIEDLLLTCLQKDPAKRIQSVAELAFRIAPFATQNVETHTLIERIDRLARSNPNQPLAASSTTGPKLALPPPFVAPAPSSSGALQNNVFDPHQSAPSFGSTGMDLSSEAQAIPPQRSLFAAVAIGLAVATIILGGVGAYKLGARASASAPSQLSTSTSTSTSGSITPPDPSLSAVAAQSAPTSMGGDPPTSTAPSSAKPTSSVTTSVGGQKGPGKLPIKHTTPKAGSPGTTNNSNAGPATTPPKSPTDDRF